MARISRKNLNTPYFHVMVQGVNKEYIFEKEKYIKKYLRSILIYEDASKFSLLAYCMMNNHAHFLFCVDDLNSFEKYMHIINLKFAKYYNNDKNRCGVVFRNRYQIEPIYNEGYLINCIKYIHNNPKEAGMVDTCDKYKYSSYNDYLYHTGVAMNPHLKEIFGFKNDYIQIIDNSSDMKFLDFDEHTDSKKYIGSGISEYLKKNNTNLLETISDRSNIIQLIKHLKEVCKINYKDIYDFLSISEGVYKRI